MNWAKQQKSGSIWFTSSKPEFCGSISLPRYLILEMGFHLYQIKGIEADLVAQFLPVRMNQGGFPGGAVVGSLPANAGHTGSRPGLGGSHMPQSSWAREPQLITEPARLEPVFRGKRGHDSERPAHCDEEWPPLATTGESPRTETKTQHSHK